MWNKEIMCPPRGHIVETIAIWTHNNGSDWEICLTSPGEYGIWMESSYMELQRLISYSTLKQTNVVCFIFQPLRFKIFCFCLTPAGNEASQQYMTLVALIS